MSEPVPTESALVAPPPEHILQFFAYDDLPPDPAALAAPFSHLAHAIVYGDNHPASGTVTSGSPVPRNPERTVALRALLDARNATLRAKAAK